MTTKTVVIELEGWQVSRMLEIVNALKNFNRVTDEKCPIDYDIVRQLDGADDFLSTHLVMEQDTCEHGNRLHWSDYRWSELEDDD